MGTIILIFKNNIFKKHAFRFRTQGKISRGKYYFEYQQFLLALANYEVLISHRVMIRIFSHFFNRILLENLSLKRSHKKYQISTYNLTERKGKNYSERSTEFR